tara:strand:- start:376 stop:678 length:303 start_codon:yes stop_codon:yes gene_type:complete
MEVNKVYESEKNRIRYEDLYSKNWYAQNRLDVSERPSLKGQYRIINRVDKKRQVEKVMSKNGLLVNRYLNRKMNVKEIADEMLVSESFVRNIIKKYQLPV